MNGFTVFCLSISQLIDFWGCFCFLALGNKTQCMCMGLCVGIYIQVSVYIPRSRISGLDDKFMFNIFRNCQAVFQINCTVYIPTSINSVSSVAQSCPTLCDPMNHSTPGLPVHHQLLEFTQTHVHRVGDAIQPSHSLSSPSPPAPNPSQDQGPFQ